MIDAGEITTFLVELLSTAAVQPECPYPGTLVGDGVAPENAGWPTGTPNVGEFVPYLVLKPSGPIATGTNIPLCDSNGVFFAVPYQVVAWHNGRTDADNLASWARKALRSVYTEAELADLKVKMNQTAIDSVVLASRDDSTFPKLWSSTTSFHVNATRSPAGK